MSYILILGAKSDIAKELAREYAKGGYDLYLAGRDIDSLKLFQKDLSITTQKDIVLKELDIEKFSTHEEFFNSLEPKPLGVIASVGFMAEQNEVQKSLDLSLKTINVNFTGCVSFLNIVAEFYEKQKNGFIIGISSVAGDRGRKTNYIYGSAKAALSAYLSGLRNRLNDSGVHVLTVKPGFVYTKMTEHLDLPPALTSQPEEVAKETKKAQESKKNVLYTKFIWKYIMLIIKHIPEFIFKRLSI